MHLFSFSPTIGNLAAVNRIFQNHADQAGIKKRIFPVLALDFADSMIFKIFCDPICTGIGCNILLIDGANRRSFLLVEMCIRDRSMADSMAEEIPNEVA